MDHHLCKTARPFDLVKFDGDRFGVVVARGQGFVNIAQQVSPAGHWTSIEYGVEDSSVVVLSRVGLADDAARRLASYIVFI